jgi:peptide deformylase
MKDRILAYPDPRLRAKAKPVEAVTPEIRERALGLVRLMHEGNGEDTGIGLAATQVGWAVRIIAINVTGEPGDDRVLVNPMVVHRSGGFESEEEGCLSVPGIRAKVDRPKKVIVEATDLEGAPVRIEADKLLARCLQHELDHLDGVLFVDRLTPARAVVVKPKLRDLEAAFHA